MSLIARVIAKIPWGYIYTTKIVLKMEMVFLLHFFNVSPTEDNIVKRSPFAQICENVWKCSITHARPVIGNVIL